MKNKIAAAFLILITTTVIAHAQEGLGIGIIIGEPTGISLKKWLDGSHAFDAAAAWSFSENESFQLHADYLFHDFSLLSSGDMSGKLPVYFGVGGRIKMKKEGKGRNEKDVLFGVRVPFGISYLFANTPVDLFAEIVPVLDVVPDTKFDLNAAIGVRYYFR